MATQRTQAQVLALIQSAVRTPDSVPLTARQWQRVSSVIEPKVGGFGTKVAAALKAKLVAGDGTGDALTEAEAKAAIALIRAASAEQLPRQNPCQMLTIMTCGNMFGMRPLYGGTKLVVYVLSFKVARKGLPGLKEAVQAWKEAFQSEKQTFRIWKNVGFKKPIPHFSG